MKMIPASFLEKAMSYPAYRQMTDERFAQGKTTGENHSEAMLQYTKISIARMARLDKTARLLPEALAIVAEIDRPMTWLALTEAWCGDAGQIIPVLAKLAGQNPNISLRLLLRDENLELMDAFLTNGGRSIPKIILLDSESRRVLGDWGPRPEEVQQMLLQRRPAIAELNDEAERKAQMQELVKDVQKWYARDKTRSIQLEFAAALSAAMALQE
ncbi:thioredoxin family protein [Phaeodactylibacter luteus]|nr:thioredoxin family protein [Phaeodactylibacter luteus]